MTFLLCVLLWVACGIGAAGFDFAYFQGHWPTLADRSRRQDLAKAVLFGLFFGPIGLIVTFFYSGMGEYGWRLR